LRNASDQVNKHIWFDFHACRVLTLDQMACAIVPSDLDGVAWKQACTALVQPDGQCRYSQGVRQMKMNAPDRETSVDGRVQLSKRRACRSEEDVRHGRSMHSEKTDCRRPHGRCLLSECAILREAHALDIHTQPLHRPYTKRLGAGLVQPYHRSSAGVAEDDYDARHGRGRQRGQI